MQSTYALVVICFLLVQLLFAKGAAVDAQNSVKQTPLHWAAQNGKTEVVELLLANGASVDAKDSDRWSPLCHAAANGHTESVKILINNEANVSAGNSAHQTPLHYAVVHGHAQVAQLLLSAGVTVDAKDVAGLTPLHFAVQAGNAKLVQLLIDSGANVNVKCKVGQSPLHHAAHNNVTGVAQLLLSSGATVNAKQEGGNTPLHFAVKRGNTEMVQFLIANGASVDAKDNHDRTPLHLAGGEGHVNPTQLLITSGATVDAKDKEGRTPLLLAVSKGKTEAVELLVKNGATLDVKDKTGKLLLSFDLAESDAMRALLQAAIKNAEMGVMIKKSDPELEDEEAKGSAIGDDANDENWAPSQNSLVVALSSLVLAVPVFMKLLRQRVFIGIRQTIVGTDDWTPLHHAAHKDDVKLVQLLLAKGVDVDAKDTRDRTPLHLAAHYGHLKVAELLISKGSSVESKDNRDWTPLYVAAWEGKQEVVELLLKNGANVDVKDDQGWTPREVAKLLIHSGTAVDAKKNRGETPLDSAESKGILRRLVGAATQRETKQAETNTRKDSQYQATDFSISTDELGRGLDGTVFKGFDKRLGRNVAVKVHTEQVELTAPSTLQKEYELLASLDHPNIVRVLFFDIHVLDDRNVEHRVFMEFVSGGSVVQAVSHDRRLQERVIQRYLRCALEGLAYLHSKKVLHRDIKPGNMLVDAEGVLKLADFGHSHELPSDRESLTTKNAIGTWPYTAPEVLAKGSYSEGSDLWALGCSVIRMATGRLPWAEVNLPPDELQVHIKKSGTHPEIPEHLSPGLYSLVETLLRQDPTERGTAASALAVTYFETPVVQPSAVSVMEQTAADGKFPPPQMGVGEEVNTPSDLGIPPPEAGGGEWHPTHKSSFTVESLLSHRSGGLPMSRTGTAGSSRRTSSGSPDAPEPPAPFGQQQQQQPQDDQTKAENGLEAELAARNDRACGTVSTSSSSDQSSSEEDSDDMFLCLSGEDTTS